MDGEDNQINNTMNAQQNQNKNETTTQDNGSK